MDISPTGSLQTTFPKAEPGPFIDGFTRPSVHVLSGAHFGTFARMLARYGGCSPRHVASVALTLGITLLREPSYCLEAARVAKRAAAVTFDPAPVIIVGHWRSGTTYLHNLMSRDPRFCFPTIVDAVMPYEFFPGMMSNMSRRLLLRNLPSNRQVDDVPLRADMPQEDEVALSAMGAPSFFNCLYFPRNYGEIFRREVLFDGIGEGERRRWRRSLKHYLGKIAALHPNQRLLLKNPAHSARIPELKAMFPKARFIHIHRDPFEVFVSMRRMVHITCSIVALQDYDQAAVDEEIMGFYPIIMDRLQAGLKDVGHHANVRYADLVKRPVETLERVYGELELGDFEAARPAIESFAAAHVTTPRSARPLDQKLSAKIADRWKTQIAALGYEH